MAESLWWDGEGGVVRAGGGEVCEGEGRGDLLVGGGLADGLAGARFSSTSTGIEIV